METGHGHHGVVGLVLDTGVGFGASYAMGQMYLRNQKWGKMVPRIAAVAGKLGAVVISALNGGDASLVGGVVDAVGQAGVNAVGLEYGMRHARKAKKLKTVLLPDTTDIKALKGAEEVTSMGALGKASPGRSLTWDQINELASSH